MLKTLLVTILPVCLYGQTASFPEAIATDNQLKIAVNGLSALLSQNIGTLETSFSVSSCTGFVGNVLITIDQEIMNVSGCTGTNMAVSARGFDSTSPAGHQSGSVVFGPIDAWHHNSVTAEVKAIEAALGTNPTVLNSTGCGTGTTCTPVAKSPAKIVVGNVAFAASTTATVSGLPAFTSASTFSCSATNPSHGYTWTIQNVSATSITITAGTSNSDTWTYSCFGY
jgi:hypothetical protein